MFDLGPEPDWFALWEMPEAQPLLHMRVSMCHAVNHCRGRLCYLATPYSKCVIDEESGAFSRMKSSTAAIQAGAWIRDFAVEGVTVVSPIALSCAAIEAGVFHEKLDPLDADFWNAWCRPMLNACGAVIVPSIDGWDESLGIWHEVCAALRANVPVYVIGGAE